MKINARHIFLGIAIALTGCTLNLTQGDLDGIPLTNEKYSFFGKIPFIHGSDTLDLEENLLKAYTAAVKAEAFPRERCRGHATIQAQMQENNSKSAWNLGVIFIPFWPVLPVDETWTYNLQAKIYCDGVLVRNVEFKEQERVQATFYGRLRTDIANKASKEMHRKLVQRLEFELDDNKPADFNSLSDF